MGTASAAVVVVVLDAVVVVALSAVFVVASVAVVGVALADVIVVASAAVVKTIHQVQVRDKEAKEQNSSSPQKSKKISR